MNNQVVQVIISQRVGGFHVAFYKEGDGDHPSAWAGPSNAIELVHTVLSAYFERPEVLNAVTLLEEHRELLAEVAKLRDGIRQHRDGKGHDRCHLDDQRLYALLGDGVEADLRLPPRDEFLRQCERYYELRRKPDGA